MTSVSPPLNRYGLTVLNSGVTPHVDELDDPVVKYAKQSILGEVSLTFAVSYLFMGYGGIQDPPGKRIHRQTRLQLAMAVHLYKA